MNFLKELYKLADFYSKAQSVLKPGTSQFQGALSEINENSYEQIKEKINFYKTQVENAIAGGLVQQRPGWSKPGEKIYAAIKTINEKQPLNDTAKGWAKAEMNGMYSAFSEASQAEFSKLLDTYTNNYGKLN